MSDFPISHPSSAALQLKQPPSRSIQVQPVPAQLDTRTQTTGSDQTKTERNPTELEKHLARQNADRRPTGPPPAFEATLLELEADIDFAIKKLEAAREKARDERALAASRDAAG